MNTLLRYIRSFRRMPQRYRSAYLRRVLTLEAYRLLSLLRGEKFTHPVPPSAEGGYIVTRAIPSGRLALFGRTIWYTDRIPLEYVPYHPDLEGQRKLVEEAAARTGRPVRHVIIMHSRSRRERAG